MVCHDDCPVLHGKKGRGWESEARKAGSFVLGPSPIVTYAGGWGWGWAGLTREIKFQNLRNRLMCRADHLGTGIDSFLLITRRY